MWDSNLSCCHKDLLFSSLPLKWCTNNRNTHRWYHGYSGNKLYLNHCEFLFIFVVSFIVGMYPASKVLAVALVLREGGREKWRKIAWICLIMLFFWEKEFKWEFKKSKYALETLHQVGEERKETCQLDWHHFFLNDISVVLPSASLI